MRSRGFSYAQDPVPTTGPLSSSTFWPQPSAAGPAELSLLAQRQQHGFGIHDSAVAPRGDPDPDDRLVASLRPAVRKRWMRAWDGSGGCYGTAQAELYGSRAAANAEQLLPGQIYDEVSRATQHERRLRLASAAWSACVRRVSGGLRFTNETAMINWLSDAGAAQLRTSSFRREEVRLAVVDTRCGFRTDQARTFAAAYAQAAERLPAGLEAELRDVWARRPVVVARARWIVASAAR